MPLFDDEDLDELADVLGDVDFTIGASSAKGFFGDQDEEVLAGEGARQFAGDITGIVRSGALAGLVVGAVITVAGAGGGQDGTYTVAEGPHRLTDGRWVKFRLAVV